MKKGQRLWTRDELLLAINLYFKLPFGRLHRSNPDVVHLANLINRTPSSVAYKLVNFASLDPSLKERGIKGAVNSSKLDKQVWDEFYNNWGELITESESLFATLDEGLRPEEYQYNDKEGKVKESIVMVRTNQSFFRKMILSTYNNTCCITGIKQPELLIAGHIIPWSIDEKNRLNPQNGMLFNGLHDKAFELGYISVTTDYQILVSNSIKESPSAIDYFLRYKEKEIILPSRFLPDPEFLKFHNQEKFIQ